MRHVGASAGTYAGLAFLSDMGAGRYTLIESLSADLERSAELVAKHDDLPLGTVDASVVALAERLNITTVVTRRTAASGKPVSEDPEGEPGRAMLDVRP
jgi:hypothetical protein